MSESNAPETIKYLTEDNLKLMYGRLNRRYVVVDALPPVDSLDPADRNVIYVVKETVAGTVRYWPNVIDNDAWKPFGIGQVDLDGKADKVDAVEGHLVVSDGNGGLADADIMPGTFVALAIDPSESIQPHATDLRKIWKAYQSGMPVALLDNRPDGTGLYAQLNAAGYTWADGGRMAECLDGVDDDNRQCDGTVHGYCTESDGVVKFYEDAGHTVEIVPENGKLYCDDTVPDGERVYRYDDGFVRALRFVQFSCNELVDDAPAWPSRRATRQVFYRMTEPYGSSSPDGFEVVYGESTADIHDQMVTGARIGEGKLLPVDAGIIVLPKSTAVNDGKLTVTVGESEPVVFTANDSADRAVVIPVATGEVAGLVRIASAVDPGDPDAAVTAAAVLDELDDYVQKADGATGGNFAELDDNGNLTDSGSKASDFKPKQAAVTDPTASGSGIEFIDSITQDTNGVIVPSKKSVQAAVASTAGVGGNAGVMSATDKEKLDGIDNYIESASVTGRTLTLTPKAGTPVQFTDTGDANLIERITVNGAEVQPAGKTVDIAVPAVNDAHLSIKLGTAAAADTGFSANSATAVTVEIPNATTGVDGLMGNADKAKLDGIEAGAQKNSIEKVTADGTDLDIVGKSVNIPAMTGATAQGVGTSGLVPAPLTEEKDKFLKGDGTWATIPPYASEPSVNNVLLLGDATGGKTWTALENDVFGTPLLDETGRPLLDEETEEPMYDASSTDQLWTGFAGKEFGAARAYADQDGNNIKATYATSSQVNEGLAKKVDVTSMSAYATSAWVEENFLKQAVIVSYDAQSEELHLDFSPAPTDYVLIGDRLYHYVQIGDQLWIDENLDYKFAYDGGTLPIGASGTPSTPAAWYYGNDEATYGVDGNKYGLLYNWYAAKYLEDNKSTLLPEGWHVPSTTDWDTLANTVGGASTAGTVLKSATGWTNGAGTDDYGFGALPAGRYYGLFNYLGSYSDFWTSIENYSNLAYYRRLDTGTSLRSNYGNKTYGFSIRLVKDLT